MQPITRQEANEMSNTEDPNDRRSDYVFSVPGHAGLCFDGSEESCPCHPGIRTVGRLLNFAPKQTKGCNVNPEYFEFPLGRKVFRTLLFVALREIEVHEELRFDYGDKNSMEMFGMS